MELYIHLPFCRKKCRYCDFISFPGMENRMEEYVDCLLLEAELHSGAVTEPPETVYLGGGTPSLLPADLLRRLLHGLRERLDLSCVSEWTSEANPGTMTLSWLDAALEGGVSRLSLGMQAGQDRLLRLLGRIHSAEDVTQSVDLARKAGFRNLNLDLIFGLPTQKRSEWRETLNLAFALAPEHLSAYGLIPEEGTPLWDDLNTGALKLPEPEEERAMYGDLLQEIRKQGMIQYEISNFARPGRECRHNIGYWDQTPYLGLGVSAASMLYRSQDSGGLRYLRRTNTGRMEEYLRGIREGRPVYSEEEWISPPESRFETMMLGLRMNRGVRDLDFYSLHGISPESCYGEKLEKLRKDGILEHVDGAWRLTGRGMDLQNTALVELMD